MRMTMARVKKYLQQKPENIKAFRDETCSWHKGYGHKRKRRTKWNVASPGFRKTEVHVWSVHYESGQSVCFFFRINYTSYLLEVTPKTTTNLKIGKEELRWSRILSCTIIAVCRHISPIGQASQAVSDVFIRKILFARPRIETENELRIRS